MFTGGNTLRQDHYSALTLLILIYCLFPLPSASGHSPIISGDNSNLDEAMFIPDPTKSWAIYVELPAGADAVVVAGRQPEEVSTSLSQQVVSMSLPNWTSLLQNRAAILLQSMDPEEAVITVLRWGSTKCIHSPNGWWKKEWIPVQLFEWIGMLAGLLFLGTGFLVGPVLAVMASLMGDRKPEPLGEQKIHYVL